MLQMEAVAQKETDLIENLIKKIEYLAAKLAACELLNYEDNLIELQHQVVQEIDKRNDLQESLDLNRKYAAGLKSKKKALEEKLDARDSQIEQLELETKVTEWCKRNYAHELNVLEKKLRRTRAMVYFGILLFVGMWIFPFFKRTSCWRAMRVRIQKLALLIASFLKPYSWLLQ